MVRIPVRTICLAASSGGHMSQLLALSESWQGREVCWVTTGQMVKTQLSDQGRVYVVGESNRTSPLKLLKVIIHCIYISIKERPCVVLSTGASVGCIMCYLGKCFGAKVVWIDSITNVDRLSLSGRLVRPIADVLITQWPELAQRYQKAEYVGVIL